MKKITSTLIFVILATAMTGCSLVKTADDTVVTPIDTNTNNTATTTDTRDETTMTTDTMVDNQPVGEQKDLAPTDTPQAIADGGVYLPYTPTAMAQARGNVVLFFYANWSPAANDVQKNITDNADSIPSDLTILKVNFDDAGELKAQYGVTEQTTFVQVTNTGELIKKWRGANTLADIVAQVETN